MKTVICVVIYIVTTNMLHAQIVAQSTDISADRDIIDTIEIIFGDSMYYDTYTFHLITADGRKRFDQKQLTFKDNNPDAYYIIHPGVGSKIDFEGRIKPGNKYHGKCITYYRESSKIMHLGAETNYTDGIRNGREVHYNRDGSINWEKKWDMGKSIP